LDIGELYYANFYEGGKRISRNQFLQDIDKRLSSRPKCVRYGISEGQLVGIWTSDWTPPWELDYIEYDNDKTTFNPPWTSTYAKLGLAIDKSGNYYLRFVYLNTPESDLAFTQDYPCIDLSALRNIPTSSPTTEEVCSNDSEFVADVNIPDGTHFRPGAPFVKTWRLLNSGTCTWDLSYQFKYVAGDLMNSLGETAIGTLVLPGETVDISVSFVTPVTAGTYRSQWQLFTANGTPFGMRPYVEIITP
jgi:hypothetical protein